jgi:Protein of unknown function (DUF4238)
LTQFSRPHVRVVTDRKPSSAVAKERDLYSLSDVPLDQTQRVEKEFMGKIDNAAALILKKLRAGNRHNLCPEERQAFTYFLMSLRARHPDAVQMSKRLGAEAIAIELGRNPEEYEALRGDGDPPTLMEFAKQVMPGQLNNIGVNTIQDVIVEQSTAERIFLMDWWIYETKSIDIDFLTSDRPCLLAGNAKSGKCVIALPLSPTMTLFITNTPEAKDRLIKLGDRTIVKRINKEIVRHADKYVYGRDAKHIRLVEKYLKKLSF